MPRKRKSSRRKSSKKKTTKKIKTVGSRAEVFHGNALHTSGYLYKSDLKLNKGGKIVSRRASARAKRDNRLVKAGFKTKKGIFVLFAKKRKSRRKTPAKKRKSRRKTPAKRRKTPAKRRKSRRKRR